MSATKRQWEDDNDEGGPAMSHAEFEVWAQAMVQAEVSRGMLDRMWERIKEKLDDLRKVEQLLASVFGPGAKMVNPDDGDTF